MKTLLSGAAMMNSLSMRYRLVVIWLSGVYCNSMLATVLGTVYVVGRLLYPLFYGWWSFYDAGRVCDTSGLLCDWWFVPFAHGKRGV